MIAAGVFLLRYFVRSHRYVAPTLLFFVALVMVYHSASPSARVAFSFGMLVAFLYAVWLTYVYMETEHTIQQQITATQLGGMVRYEVIRLAGICTWSSVAAFLAWLYPLGVRAVNADAGTAAMALLLHLLSVLSGVMVAAFFQSRWILARNARVLLLSLVTVAALGGQAIGSALPGPARPLTWILPPVARLAYAFSNWTAIPRFDRWLPVGWTVCYIAFCAAGYFTLAWRRRFT